MEDAISLEQQLSEVERCIDNALKSTGQSMAGLKKAKRAAKNGDLATLKAAISGQTEMARVARADQSRVEWGLSDEAER